MLEGGKAPPSPFDLDGSDRCGAIQQQSMRPQAALLERAGGER